MPREPSHDPHHDCPATAGMVVPSRFTPPPILPQSDALHSLLWTAHRTLAFAFFALILLHLGATLFHALIRRDGVFEAMAPVPDRSIASLAE